MLSQGRYSYPVLLKTWLLDLVSILLIVVLMNLKEFQVYGVSLLWQVNLSNPERIA